MARPYSVEMKTWRLGIPAKLAPAPKALKPEPQLALPTPRENAAPAG